MLEESEQGGRYRARFEYAHPIDGIELMAGPYDVTHRDATLASGKAVRLRTYFAPALRELADSYLAAVRRYLDLYEGWIGEYAFSEFSVVSSPTPTGFGMPTLTYLGEDVLRLPFIRDSSLGHEVLHNWWGNGVRPDYARGNWSEALTTFMADYTYREQAGADAARAMRLEWLRDLAALPGSEDRPIAAFTGRYHGASQIIGYHKPAMVFSMLRDRIGRDAFDRGVQRFWREHRHRVASWGDLRHAFEAASGQTLQAFFAQWLTRTGLPAVRITQADVTAAASVHRLRVTLAQDAPTFALQLPLVIRTAGGESMHLIDLQGAERTIEFDLAERPRSLVLDPELRALRRLDAREAPPILRSVMVDSASVLVVPTSDPPLIEAARALGSRLFDHVPALADERGRRPDAPFLVVGMHADVDAWLTRNGLAARPPSLSRSGDAHVWMARGADARAYGVVSLANAQALAAVTRLLPHYGRQSWVSFAGGKVTERGVWPARPVEWTLD
jgi:aminopeptidase N